MCRLLSLALVEQRGGKSDAVHDPDTIESGRTESQRIPEVAAGSLTTALSCQVTSGYRAGAGMFGGVEVRHPVGYIAKSAGKNLISGSHVPVGLALVAEGRVHPSGLRSDQGIHYWPPGFSRSNTEEAESVIRAAKVDHLV
ncbi:hypothetical protein CU044_5210 [Streptomyces sp. L-9-10]|nr:hypothetical protein CU044_5210 [Streptomyces sp. L-9-10]